MNEMNSRKNAVSLQQKQPKKLKFMLIKLKQKKLPLKTLLTETVQMI